MCSGPTPPLGLEPQTQVLVFDPDHSNDKKFPVTSYYLSLERGLWRLGSIRNRKLGEIDKILRSFKDFKNKSVYKLKKEERLTSFGSSAKMWKLGKYKIQENFEIVVNDKKNLEKFEKS